MLWCQITSGCRAKGWVTGILWGPFQLRLLYSSVIKPRNPYGFKLLRHYKGTIEKCLQSNVLDSKTELTLGFLTEVTNECWSSQFTSHCSLHPTILSTFSFLTFSQLEDGIYTWSWGLNPHFAGHSKLHAILITSSKFQFKVYCCTDLVMMLW